MRYEAANTPLVYAMSGVFCRSRSLEQFVFFAQIHVGVLDVRFIRQSPRRFLGRRSQMHAITAVLSVLRNAQTRVIRQNKYQLSLTDPRDKVVL